MRLKLRVMISISSAVALLRIWLALMEHMIRFPLTYPLWESILSRDLESLL